MKNKNITQVNSIIPIARNMFYNKVKLENLKEEEVEKIKSISSTLFQVVTFIEMFRTYDGYISFNLDLIIGYYKLRNTKRLRVDISKSIKFLDEIGTINVINMEEDILPDNFILVEVKYEKERFFSHDSEIIVRLINTIHENNEKYIIGLLYYYICSRLDYDMKYESYMETQIYYSHMSKALGIKSNKTLQRYIDFLEENKFIETRVEYEENKVGESNKRKFYKLGGWNGD